jgi:hypothetical protein
MRSPSGNHLPLELIDPVAASRRKKGFRNFLKSGNSIKNSGPGASPENWKRGKGSGQPGGSRCGEDEEGPFEPVATVVVENDFEQVVPLAARSDSGSTNRTPGASGTHGPTTKEGSSLFGKSEDKEASKMEGEAEDNAEHNGGSTKGEKKDKEWIQWIQSTWIYEFLFITIWPSIVYFFNSKYTDAAKERAFIKEASRSYCTPIHHHTANLQTWFQSKLGAMASALFFLISWALSTGLQPKMTPFVLIAYLGVGGVSSLLLLF